MKKLISVIGIVLISAWANVYAGNILIANGTKGVFKALVQTCYAMLDANGASAGWDCKFYDTQVMPMSINSTHAMISVPIQDKPNTERPPMPGYTWANEQPPYAYIPYKYVSAIIDDTKAKPIGPWAYGENSPCGTYSDSNKVIYFQAYDNVLVCNSMGASAR